MKAIILTAALLLGGLSAIAQTTSEAKNDTIAIPASEKVTLVEHKTTNGKGKEVIKYFVCVNQELISTSKSVAERIKLCEQYNAKCALSIVKNGKTNKKRVILN